MKVRTFKQNAMNRRVFLGSLGAGLLGSCLQAEAKRTAKFARIGLLRPQSPPDPYTTAIRTSLRNLGYVEGQTVEFEDRWAEGRVERLPALAADLVRAGVDVIVAISTPAALAAKEATATIPIVIAYIGDPVGAGLVASLGRPGGNITGVSVLNVEYSAKWLEFLKAAVPKLSRAVVLGNPANANHTVLMRPLEIASARLHVSLHLVEAHDSSEFDHAFGGMIRERADGLIVLPDPRFTREHLVALVRRHRIPAIYQYREFAEAGGLLAYGPPLAAISDRAALYVDKILKGAKPGDLPVEQPTTLELVVNLKAAKELGLAIPQSLVGRADVVIQ
jgi:putative tryptophan/tyrosine transport system substrate-binding protein